MDGVLRFSTPLSGARGNRLDEIDSYAGRKSNERRQRLTWRPQKGFWLRLPAQVLSVCSGD